jgi:hypothetical protein
VQLYLREALALNLEVVNVARANAPAGELAGALANLAGVYATMAKLFVDEDPTASEQAKNLLGEALVIYQDEENADRVADIQRSLSVLS